MSIILGSRGHFSETTSSVLRVLPLAVSSVVAMTVFSRRQPVLPDRVPCENDSRTASCSADFSGIHAMQNFTSSLESKGVRAEGIVKAGSLAKEVSSTALAHNADAVILVEEPSRTRKLRFLASDGLAVMKKTGKPVILQPNGCTVSGTGGILVVMSGTHRSPKSQWLLERTMNLAGREVVVLSVSIPFYPLFSRAAVGMRACRSEALHWIWAEQAEKAGLPAEALAGRLKDAGAKCWFVSRTGRFSGETLKATRSTDVSLVCILLDPTLGRRWFGKSELADLLEALGVPVMLVPCERA